MGRQDRTVTRSFRLSESGIKAIESEAERQRISVNALVNNMFLKFSTVDQFIDMVRLIRIPSETLKEILELIPDDSLTEIGRKSVTRSFGVTPIMPITGATSVEEAIKFQKLWGQSNHIRVLDVKNQGRRVVTCFTGLSRKWSIFYASSWSTVFEKLGASPKVSISEDIVVFEF